VQNLVFYGVSQNTGKSPSYSLMEKSRSILSGVWLSNPYISFGAGALVEIVAYAVVHLVLHRWGRKSTYCVFVSGFAVFALLVVPVQMLMIKDSRGILLLRILEGLTLSFALFFIKVNTV
jgi:hypothetical protein